jgi:hypothetical protein
VIEAPKARTLGYAQEWHEGFAKPGKEWPYIERITFDEKGERMV